MAPRRQAISSSLPTRSAVVLWVMALEPQHVFPFGVGLQRQQREVGFEDAGRGRPAP